MVSDLYQFLDSVLMFCTSVNRMSSLRVLYERFLQLFLKIVITGMLAVLWDVHMKVILHLRQLLK